MSAEGGGGEQVVVNRAAVSSWETFKVVGPINLINMSRVSLSYHSDG